MITEEEFKTRVIEKHGDSISFNNFISVSDYADFKCNICGHEWRAQCGNITNGHGCKICANKRKSLKRIMSIEEVKRRLFKTHGNNIAIEKYISMKTDGTFKCNVCGNIWDAEVCSVTRGNGCSVCSANEARVKYQLPIEEIREYIESHGCKLKSDTYINRKEKIDIEFACGHTVPMSYECFKRGQRCNCDAVERAIATSNEKTKNKVLSAIDSVGFKFVSFSNGTSIWHSDFTYICDKGHEVTQCVSAFMHNKYCKICSNDFTESSIATLTKNYCVEKFGKDDAIVEYKVMKNPKTNMWLKNDIYIKSLKLTIEVNGLQHYQWKNKYHRSIEEFSDQQYRDNLKKEYALSNGYYLEIDLTKIKSKEESINLLENCINSILFQSNSLN
jgi:hypothetical protein